MTILHPWANLSTLSAFGTNQNRLVRETSLHHDCVHHDSRDRYRSCLPFFHLHPDWLVPGKCAVEVNCNWELKTRGMGVWAGNYLSEATVGGILEIRDQVARPGAGRVSRQVVAAELELIPSPLLGDPMRREPAS